MSKFPWCISSNQNKDERAAARDAFYEELETIHRDVSNDEWDAIVKPMNFSEHPGLEPFIERPAQIQGPWFTLKRPLEPWAKVKAFVTTATTDSLARSVITDAQLINAWNLTGLSNHEDYEAAKAVATGTRTRGADSMEQLNEIRALAEAYSGQFESNKTDANQSLFEIIQKLETFRTTIGELGAGGNASVPIDDKKGGALLEKWIKEDFIVNVESLIANHQSYNDSLRNITEECPNRDDIKDYYIDALLLMAYPQVLKEQGEKDREIINDLQASAMSQDLSNISGLARDRKNIRAILEAQVTAAAVEAFATEAVFREQCFMLTNLPKFVQARITQDELAGIPYALKNYQTPELKDRLEKSGKLKSYIDSNKPINIQGDPFPFINKLTVSPNQAALFDLREEQISSLTPRIRLFKSEYNKETKKEEEIEIKFEAHAGNEVLGYISRKGRGGRGLGVGVKGFTFSYDGTDPFSAKKAISAKLDIYAPSFSDLLRERTGTTKSGKKTKYKYVDLALKTGGNITKNKKKKLSQIDQENLDKLNFRIRVMIEFAASKDVLRTFRNEQKKYSNVLKDAVYDSAMSIYLTPTIHEFDFDEAGGVQFSINYLAYIEDYFSQPNFDIFTEVQHIKKARNEVLAYFKEENCGEKEGYEKFKQQDLNFIERVNERSLNTIVREMFLSQKIYFLNLTDTMIKNFFSNPFDFDVDLKKQSMSELEKDATDVMKAVLEERKDNATATEDEGASGVAGRKRKILASLVAHSENNTKVSFMYLNDIVSTVMKLLNDGLHRNAEGGDGAVNKDIEDYINNVASSLTSPERLKELVMGEEEALEQGVNATRAFNAYKQMRVVLGPANVGLPQNEGIICPLGDIPISLNYFIDFMSEKLLSKNLSSYPLSKFVKDLINDCVKNFVNDDTCNRVDLGQKMQINSTTILSYDTRENQYTEDNLSDLIASQMRIKDKEGVKIATREVLEMDKLNIKLFPLLKVSGPREDPRTFLEYDKMRNYYIFSASRKYPSNAYLGNRAKDAKNGIFHYILGEDKGMLKSISLDKTNTPGLKELRFEQEGFAGLEQLREVYNANISTFLNVQTFPGTYIYIEPEGFDPTASEDLSRFGIGGYYMITKTSHTIQPGNAETQINAAWVASKGTYIRSEEDGSKEEQKGPERQKKCQAVGFRK